MANKLSKLTESDLKSTAGMDYPSPSVSSDKESERQRRMYRAKDALRTLKQAAAIRADKQLMADVKVCAAAELKELQSVRKI